MMTIDPLLLGTVYLAGLVSFFSPCIFPVLPVYISILMQGGERSVTRTLLFVFGLFVTFFFIGMSAGVVGQLLSSDALRLLGAVFIIFLGIYQIGWIRIPLLERSQLFGRDWQRNSEWAPFFIGITFSLGWTPCVGPVLASILVVASTTGTIASSILTMVVYMLGIATPFVIISLASKTLLYRLNVVKAYLGTIQKVGGILLLCVGIFMLVQQFTQFTFEKPASVAALVGTTDTNNNAKGTSNDDVDAASSLQHIVLEDINGKPVPLDSFKGKPVYIKLWASWCPVCLRGLPEIDAMSAQAHPNEEIITIVFPGQFGEKDAEAFRTWYAKQGYTHMVVLLDTKGEVARKVNVRAFPTNVFLDPTLHIRQVIPGHMSQDMIQYVFDLK